MIGTLLSSFTVCEKSAGPVRSLRAAVETVELVSWPLGVSLPQRKFE